MRSKFLIVAFAVICLAMIGNLALVILDVQAQSQRINDDINDRVTGVTQGLQRETMALTRELLLTHHGHVDNPQLKMRLDILASRLAMLKSGKVGEELWQISKIKPLLRDLQDSFEELEAKLSSGKASEIGQIHPVTGTQALFIANKMTEIASQIATEVQYFSANMHVHEQTEWTRFLRSIYIQLIIGAATFAAMV
ncbi:hypothetical protein C9975_01230 [Thalassospira xiamenensis]|nr:hypothetical protein C9975_01230 [Thalassospira xiamenensis]